MRFICQGFLYLYIHVKYDYIPDKDVTE